MNEILEQLKMLNTRVSAMEGNYVEMDHSKKPELAVQSKHSKKSDLEGDDGTHLKTQATNKVIIAGISKAKEEAFTIVTKKKNYNLNKVFEKSYAPSHLQKIKIIHTTSGTNLRKILKPRKENL